jgi:signal transduction histidine kinase
MMPTKLVELVDLSFDGPRTLPAPDPTIESRPDDIPAGMAKQVEAHDWTGSSLGPRSGWSPELVCAERLVLSFATPACLYWGPEGEMLYNDAYRQDVLGGREVRALGRPAREVWNQAWDVMGPELKAAYEGGRTIHDEGVLIPLQREGEWKQLYWDSQQAPLYQGGRVAGVFSTLAEVTARVLALRRGSQAESQLEQVLEVATDGILCISREWRVTYINGRGASLLAASGAIAGRAFWEVFPDAVYDGSPYLEHYYRAMDEGIAGDFEAFYGKPLNLWFKVEARPSTDGIVVCFRDVTKEKRSFEQMRTNERLMSVGRLAASLAHEINTPLESIMNLLYLARLDAEGPEQKALLEEAELEVERISVIATQTLRFHNQSSRLAKATGAELFSTIVSLYQGKCKTSGIEVFTRWRSAEVVCCFAGEIRQVLGNMVANAIDAMGSGGRLILRSRSGTDWKTGRSGLFLTVADTGSGIEAGTLASMFEAFFTTKGDAGTGLGLWISAEMVARHHGRLQVRSSQKVGHCGTTICLFLPFGSVPKVGGVLPELGGIDA